MSNIGILLMFAELSVLWPEEAKWEKKPKTHPPPKKTEHAFFPNYLTLRNVHFSDDCALIASLSAQVYCLYNISPI